MQIYINYKLINKDLPSLKIGHFTLAALIKFIKTVFSSISIKTDIQDCFIENDQDKV